MSRKCLWHGSVLRVLGVVFIAFLTSYSAAWLWSVSRLGALIELKADELRGRGWDVVIGPMRRGGWPGQAQIELGPSSVAYGGFELRASALVAETALLHPGPLVLRSTGHSLRFGADPGSPVSTDDIVAETLSDGVLLTGAHLRIPHLFEAAGFRMRVGPTYVGVVARHFELFDARGTSSPPVDDLEMHMEMTDSVPFADSQRSVDPWRIVGNTLDVTLSRLATAGFSATGRLRLQPNDALQPRGEGMMHVADYATGLDSLAAAGVVSTNAVIAAKAVLNLLAVSSPDTGVDVPLRVDGHTLYVAGFALVRLPTLDRPGTGAMP